MAVILKVFPGCLAANLIVNFGSNAPRFTEEAFVKLILTTLKCSAVVGLSLHASDWVAHRRVGGTLESVVKCFGSYFFCILSFSYLTAIAAKWLPSTSLGTPYEIALNTQLSSIFGLVSALLIYSYIE